MSVNAPPSAPEPSTEAAFPGVRDRRSSRRLTAAGWLLAGWCVALAAANALWLAADRRPPSWDPAAHLISSLGYREGLLDLMHGKAPLGETLDRLLAVDAYYPPLVPFVGAVVTLGAPPNAHLSTWVVNQLFLALLVVGTFRLGRRLAGAVTGIAAAFAVTTFPGIFSASHAFMLDLPLAAIVVLALDSLFASEAFARRGASAGFGLLCGVGMLTKWTFAFFLAAPLFVEAVRALFREGERPRRIGNLALALALGGLLALPWYVIHAPNLAQDVAGFGFTRGDWRAFPAVWSPAGVTFYPQAFVRLLFLPWFLLLVSGLAVAWRHSGVRLLALVSIPVVVLLTLLPAKDDRYLLPLLPMAAVLATAWVGEKTRPLGWKTAAMGVAAAMSVFFAVRRDPPKGQLWPIESLVESLPTATSGIPPCVRVIPDTAEFNRFVFEYAARQAGRDVEIAGDGRFPWFTDAVILKTGPQGAHPNAAGIMAAIGRNEGGFCDVFHRTWRDDLPDGSKGEIWVRDVRPLTATTPGELLAKLETAARREIGRRIGAPFAGRIEVETISDSETLRGEFRRISVFARDVEVRGNGGGSPALRVRELACDLEEVAVNPYRLRDTGEIELLSLGAIAPRLVVSEEDASAYLSTRGGATGSRVAFRDGRIRLSLSNSRLPPVSLALVPRIVGGDNLAFGFESLRVAGIPLPTSLLSALLSQYNPVLKQMPCRVRLGAVLCEGGTLRIEAAGRF